MHADVQIYPITTKRVALLLLIKCLALFVVVLGGHIYLNKVLKMKIISILYSLLFTSFCAHATSVTLDFSSGSYGPSNFWYEEDGFRVHASHGFHSVKLNTLAWYEGDNVITIDANGGLFDLKQLKIVDTAYAGLVFESSKGGFLSVGGIKGILDFSGDQWSAIDFFTVTTDHFDILNELDNIVLMPTPLNSTVPEPASILLVIPALAILGSRKRYFSKINILRVS